MVISSRTRRGDQPDDPPITSGPLPPPLWPSSKAHQREAGWRPTRPSGSSGCPSEREVCSSLLPIARQKAAAVGQYLRRRRRAARSPQAPPFLELSGGKTCGESRPPHTQLTIRLRVRRCGCSRTAACRAVAGAVAGTAPASREPFGSGMFCRCQSCSWSSDLQAAEARAKQGAVGVSRWRWWEHTATGGVCDEGSRNARGRAVF